MLQLDTVACCNLIPLHVATRATLFLESWKRLQNTLAKQWGVDDFEEVQRTAHTDASRSTQHPCGPKYPIRHGIPRRTVSHTARCPGRSLQTEEDSPLYWGIEKIDHKNGA